MAGPRGADSAAGNVCRVHHRSGGLPAPGDGPEARPNACLPPPIARTAVLIFPERRFYAEPAEGAELPVRPDLLREVVLTMHRYLITESY